MSEVLVLVEHTNGVIAKVTPELLTAARALGTPSAVVVGESGVTEEITKSLGEFGAEKTYVVPFDGDFLVAPKSEILAELTNRVTPAAIVIASTSEGREVAGRLAVRLGSGLLSDVVGINDDGTAQQVIFAGAVNVTSRVTTGIPIYSVRPNSVTPIPQNVTTATETMDITISDAAKKSTILERIVEKKGSRPELTEASIVVSGGRGVGSAENFHLIEALADAVGAAVGASRAATDSGYYPHQFQVGQTGKTVSPQLYMAIGISGAIQHRAGMQTSKTIIAINKDPEAPIFELVDFGIVGDLFNVVPQATEEILRRKG